MIWADRGAAMLGIVMLAACQSDPSPPVVADEPAVRVRVVPPAPPAPMHYHPAVYFESGVEKVRIDVSMWAIIGRSVPDWGRAYIQLFSHTDTVGSDADNLALSRRRAEGVALHASSFGVPLDHITIIACGERVLNAQSPDDVDQPLNRNVVINWGPAEPRITWGRYDVCDIYRLSDPLSD